MKIDHKDKKILWYLSRDASVSKKALAKKVGLSKDAVLYRIEKLLREKVILTIIPIVEITFIGYRNYQVLFNVQSHQEQTRKFIEYLIRHPFTLSVQKLSGPWQISAEFACKDILQFHENLDSLLHQFGQQILAIETNISIALWKFEPIAPIFGKELKLSSVFQKSVSPSQKSVILDQVDRKILYVMTTFCSIPLINIAQKIGLSSQTITYRLNKLKTEGVFQGMRLVLNTDALGYSHYLFILELMNYDSKEIDRLKSSLHQNDNLEYAYKTTGSLRVIMHGMFHDAIEVDFLIEELKYQFPQLIKSISFMLIREEYKDCLFPQGLLEDPTQSQE